VINLDNSADEVVTKTVRQAGEKFGSAANVTRNSRRSGVPQIMSKPRDVRR